MCGERHRRRGFAGRDRPIRSVAAGSQGAMDEQAWIDSSNPGVNERQKIDAELRRREGQ
jgi:hypothetical protein